MKSKSVGCIGRFLLSIVGFIVGSIVGFFINLEFISSNVGSGVPSILSSLFTYTFFGGVVGVVVFNWLGGLINSNINLKSNFIDKDKELKELRGYATITEDEYHYRKGRLMDS